MTAPTFALSKPWTRCLAAALVCVGVAACQEPERAASYHKAFPLTVSKETVALSVAAPGDSGYLGQQAIDFEGFVVDYQNRGRSPLLVEAGGAGADRVRALLLGAGIAAENISVVAPAAGAGTIRLSFTANKAEIPECGQFTSSTSPNWTNRRHSNYGCATRRNLGLMVRDPGDLDAAQPETSPDSNRLLGVIGKHSAPAAAGGAAPAAGAKK